MSYSALKYSVTLKTELGVVQVIENGAVQQIIYDLLLVRHCKYAIVLMAQET